MIIDTHAHLTGPDALYSYYRALAAAATPVGQPKAPEISDDVLEAITAFVSRLRGTQTAPVAAQGLLW